MFKKLLVALLFFPAFFPLVQAFEFSSVKNNASLVLSDPASSITFENPEAASCFNIVEEVNGNSKTFKFTFNPACSVCGKFPVRILAPSRAETLTSPFRKAISISCNADVLLVSRYKVSTLSQDSSGLAAYVKRAAEEGLTVRQAVLYTGSEYAAPELPTGVFSFFVKAEKGMTISPWASTLHQASTNDAIRLLRSKASPKYIIILGDPNAIPQYAYALGDDPFDPQFEEYYSDHAYSTLSGRPMDKAVVSISRIPFKNAQEIDAFLLRAVAKKQVGKPAILTLNERNSLIDVNTRNSVLNYYYGSTQCNAGSKCSYAPAVCASSSEQCKPSDFYNFLQSSDHLIFRLHGTYSALLGPEIKANANDEEHEYFVVADAEELGQNRLNGALVHFHSCRALLLVDDKGKMYQDAISLAALKNGGALGVLGRSGRSSYVDVLASRGKSVRLGDELLRLKGRSGRADQAVKLSYYGDPLLQVKT